MVTGCERTLSMNLTTRKQIIDMAVNRYLEARIDAEWSVIAELQSLACGIAAKHADPDFAALAVSMDDDLRAAWPTP